MNLKQDHYNKGYNHSKYIEALQFAINKIYIHVPDYVNNLVLRPTLYIQIQEIFNIITEEIITSDIPSRKHANPISLNQGIITRDFFVKFSTHVVGYVGSLLKNLHITAFIRVAEYYNRGFFQHAYIVIPITNEFYNARTDQENYLVLDPVSGEFNTEEPFTNFEDYKI